MTQLTEQLTAGAVASLSTAGRTTIGNDVVYMPTFVKACTPLFISRGYTAAELAYCGRFADQLLRYASTWAAKEAVYKVVKQLYPERKLWWRDIEVTRNKIQGRPTVVISKFVDIPPISLSISHDGDYIWAVAVCTSL